MLPPGTEVNWGLIKSNQLDVMEETCKAKILRPFKVPPGKSAPLIMERDERQHAYWRGGGALSLPGLCTTPYSCQLSRICSLLCVFSAFAQDGRHQPFLQPWRRWD